MIISNYKYQQVRKSTNQGENRYRIDGKTGTAARYNDSPNTYYYIIDIWTHKQQITIRLTL